jgi:hypothetical protein
MKICLVCGQRRPLFSVRGGPVKLDNKHTLCKACYRNQYNRTHIKIKKLNMTNIISLTEKQNALSKLITDGEVIFGGKDLPDPSDPSDPKFTSLIHISNGSAVTELLYDETGLVATGIPALHVSLWDVNNIAYLKHWLCKVLDDPKIYRANEIKISAMGDWRLALRK